MIRYLLAGSAGLLLMPSVTFAEAAAHHGPLHVSPWMVLPFALLLLCIALLPIFAGHFWHSNLRKAIVSIVLAVPVVAYLYWHQRTTGEPAIGALKHALQEYFDFIVLLASLYTVAGGIALTGYLRPSPRLNVILLLMGAVLANFIGTTGASMVLIRPYLRMNLERRFRAHLPIFFIFIVSNLGGLLTPLGDPPLFLGFLRGVDFFWTMRLLPHWAVALGLTLGIFFIWDKILFSREKFTSELPPTDEPPRLRGLINLVLLVGIVLSVLLESPALTRSLGVDNLLIGWLGQPSLSSPYGSFVRIGIAVLSLLLTPRSVREANDFNWEAIIEVAVLFIGIFITMVPALELLKAQQLGISRPWEYFWATGILSSFLDNAPTYLAFATMAAGTAPLASLTVSQPLILEAISVGAVFMGANTYIGNGPNFMVKAISDGMGYRTPSFFGYMAYSGMILVPIFVLITFFFFL